MIITDQFVVLNFPKTGSTFVRDVLRRIHHRRAGGLGARLLAAVGLRRRPLFRELMLPNIRVKRNAHVRDQHGTYQQVPAGHKHKPLVSVLRHPCDHIVSEYEYREWVRTPPDDVDTIRAHFPRFPDLTFEDFVHLRDRVRIPTRLEGRRPPAAVGDLTVLFLQFFAKDPDALLASLTDEAIDSGAYRGKLAPVRLLKTESRNQDLYQFLLEYGYPEEEIAFILKEKKIYPPGSTRTEQQRWQ
jgi:hypothetical protein